MFIIRHRTWFYTFSAVIIALSIVSLVIFGLRPGIDFTGGSILEVEFLGDRPSADMLRGRMEAGGFSEARLQITDARGVLVRLRDLNENEHQQALLALSGGATPATIFEERRFDSIGPTIGAELRRKAFIALIGVLALILAF